MPNPMKLTPLGDQAVLAHAPDEALAAHWAAAVRAAQPSWLIDVVPAYASVAVFFDPNRTSYRDVELWLAQLRPNANANATGQLFVVPCCYEKGPDLDRVAALTKLSPKEVIARHADRDYTVFAVGFCPGFPYMGYLPDELSGVPRLESPRLRVEPGSVGLTGRQTGIYPLPRPGGWNLIGQTPIELVDLASGYFLFAPGDQVRFISIGHAEFRRRLGERLETGRKV